MVSHRLDRTRVLFGTFCLTAALSGCGEAAPGSSAWIAARVEEATERLQASDGGRRLLAVLEAHGGLQAWYSAPTSAYAWEYSNFSSSMRFKSYLVADNLTRRVYHDLLTFGTPDSVAEVDARFAWDGERAWISPGERRQPNPRFWALTGYYFQSIPFVLADPGIRFRVLPPEVLDGVEYERIMAYFEPGVGDSSGDVYVVYPGESGRVAAVLYTVTYGREHEASPEGPAPPETGTFLRYEEYVTVDGLTVPTRFRGFSYATGQLGEPRNEAWVSDISFREVFDESRLEMPVDARVEPYPVE